MLKIPSSVSVDLLLLTRCRPLSYSPTATSACLLPCSHHNDNQLNSETVRKIPQLNILLIRVAVVMVSIHSNRNPKTASFLQLYFEINLLTSGFFFMHL